MRQLLLSVVSVVTLSAVQAMAADMPLRAPPVPVFSWQGCYIGGQGGWNWGRSRHDGFAPGPVELTPRFDLNGSEFGVEYGCNYTFGGTWVIGTESDFSWTDKRGHSFDTGPGGVPTFESRTKEHWNSTTRLRLGWAWDRTLFYATGGVALARVEADLTIPGFAPFTQERNHWGWTIGGGIEQAIMGGWSFKAEFLYMRFQDKSFDFHDAPVVVLTNAQRSSVNLEDYVLRVGVNYKFIDCLLCLLAPR
jgi:outer membrane immunogenic protein